MRHLGLAAVIGVLFISGQALACSIGDIGCDPFVLEPIPTITLEPVLEFEPIQQPQPAPAVTESALDWCIFYVRGQRGLQNEASNAYCSGVFRANGY